MTCYHPVPAYRTGTGVVFSELRRHDILGRIDLPCGQCIGCRMRRASDWELRVMHEASLWPVNCFVTLTYGRDQLPPHGSLCHEDYQKFMKRLRVSRGRAICPTGADKTQQHNKTIRFYMCGEYGPENGRPHYHACLFNVDFRSDRVPQGKSASGALFYDSAELRKLWGHGRVSVQDLTPETASYCARYIMKKVLGPDAKTAYSRVTEDGEVIMRRPEYAAMSLRPGIGANWYSRYSRDVFPSDNVVQRGVVRRVPKYYDRLQKRSGEVLRDEIEFKRQQAAILAQHEVTDERLAVREEVHSARVQNLRRNDV